MVSVIENRKLGAERTQLLDVEVGGDRRYLIVRTTGDDSPLGIYHHAASLISAFLILAYAVHRHHTALVFYRPCPYQRVPDWLSAGGPVGDDDDAVVVAVVAAPHREAKVVAYKQQPSPSSASHHGTLLSSEVVSVLACIAKQVALVIIRYLAVGTDEIMAVVVDDASVGLMFSFRDAPTDGGVPALRF